MGFGDSCLAFFELFYLRVREQGKWNCVSVSTVDVGLLAKGSSFSSLIAIVFSHQCHICLESVMFGNFSITFQLELSALYIDFFKSGENPAASSI